MRTDRHWLHQKLVAFARSYGLKAAAREFGCSRNTVRQWQRRYQPGKPSSLAERSRRPKHCPHQTSQALEGQIVRLRKRTGFGAQRLREEFRLARQPQRRGAPPPPAWTDTPAQEKARHQEASASGQTRLATLEPALHRH
jgi:transposase